LQDLAYPIGSYLLAKDSCAVLRSTAIRAELHAMFLRGLGLPWQLGPCRVLWVPRVIPPHGGSQRWLESPVPTPADNSVECHKSNARSTAHRTASLTGKDYSSCLHLLRCNHNEYIPMRIIAWLSLVATHPQTRSCAHDTG
jgi:hypothetical protein